MLFTANHFQALDSNGYPLSGGVVKFYEPETTTPKAVYADAFFETSLGSEVTLDAAGRAVIFLTGNYKVRVEDKNGIEVETVDNINAADEPVATTGIYNASFEEQNGIPGWAITESGTGRVERVTNDSYSGEASIRITSDGTGGGEIESAYQIVTPDRTYQVPFAIKSSRADVHNTVQVRFYDDAKTLVSTVSVYDDAETNATAWAVKAPTVVPPVTARYARLRAVGVEADGAAGTVHFDGFEIVAIPAITSLPGVGNFLQNGGTDITALLTGTLANRPDAEGLKRWYFATDQGFNGLMYRELAEEWELIQLNRPLERVLVQATEGQATVIDNYVDVTWNSAVYDVGDWWSSGPTIIAPRGGVIVVSASSSWLPNADPQKQIRILKNGAPFSSPLLMNTSVGQSGFPEEVYSLTSFPIEVGEDDEFKFQVRPNNGTALVAGSWLSAYYIE